MKITEFDISTKRGETQKTRWLVTQSIPYPDITGECGRLKWRNGGGLFPSYGNKATGLAPHYICYLLTPDAAIPPDGNYNRTHFAGFQNYDTKAINPGALVYRGKSLGELSITFENNPDWPTIRTNCTEHPSSGERAMLYELVIPKLKAFIAENKAAFYIDAVNRVHEQFKKKLTEAQEQLTALEREASDVITMLNLKKI